ncbi:hypothetical protein PCANC_22722 [Puccinia coronata f. sp. avenae]|uniref:SWIM-type domain-containing protein n=1 Tax=Puccinia coronata f. sp. avenae TaxID=200324 RepID=A0A2N5S662_9BASI|nr:hypothetical protein PCANC_22722 [Puccinia coronata f. sp. avenae]
MYADVADQGPKHYWCWFHVLKAFKGQALTYLHKQSSEAITEFQTIMHSSLDPPADIATFLSKWNNINPAFADYVRTQWVVNLKHWPSFYCTTAYQGINTNNYTEILIDEVEPSYQTAYDRVDGGFEEQTLNSFQLVSKRLADGYTKQSLATLGVHIFSFPGHCIIGSFTRPTELSYIVTTNDQGGNTKGRITSCTCASFIQHGSGCKHMFYLAHETKRNVVEDIVWPNQSAHVDLMQLFGNGTTTATPSNSGSDVEIVRPESPRNMLPIKHAPVAVSPCSQDRSAPSNPRTPDWETAHPNLAAPAQHSANPALLVPAITIQEATVEPGASTNSSSGEESEGPSKTKPTKEAVTEEERIDRVFRSAMVALKRAVDGHTKAKDRKKMITHMSVWLMERFKEVGFSAGRQVEVKCPGLRKSTLTDFSCMTDSRDLNQANLEQLLKDFQSAGHAGLKQALKLLGTKWFERGFVEEATVTCMVVFRDTCFEAVTILKDAGVLA